MKVLLLLLALANVVLGLWEWRHQPLPQSSALNAQLPTILLVEEVARARRGAIISAAIDQPLDDWEHSPALAVLAAAQAKTEAAGDQVRRLLVANAIPATPTPAPEPLPPATGQPEAKPVMTCYEAGPFNDEAELTQWLNSRALKNLETVYQEHEVPADYQVYFPAAKDQEQLRINKMMLNAKGIVDLWVVPSGSDKGALSLGVFADQQRANDFRNELQAKGIKAEVKQRFKPVQQYFAKLKLDNNLQQQLINSAQALLAPCRQ